MSPFFILGLCDLHLLSRLITFLSSEVVVNLLFVCLFVFEQRGFRSDSEAVV